MANTAPMGRPSAIATPSNGSLNHTGRPNSCCGRPMVKASIDTQKPTYNRYQPLSGAWDRRQNTT
ncbi:hypothetical protein D3C81_2150730 [compost metagenome]